MNLVIDSSVFIAYGLFNKLYRIANAVQEYDLVIFANENLLSEVERNLMKTNTKTKEEVNQSLGFIRSFVEVVTVKNLFNNSPDPKDNFFIRYCLANQQRNHCKSRKSVITI